MRPASFVGLVLLLAAWVVVAALRLVATRSLDGALILGWPGADLGQFRIGAVLSATVAGALLGTSGALLQAVLRNPLASPFVLGVSSGAGLGVALATVAAGGASGALVGGGAGVLPATVGAIGALGVVMALGRRGGAADPTTLVLAGVIVGAIATAATMVVESALPLGRRGELTTWLLGRIPESPDPALLWVAGAVAVAAAGISVWLGPALDAATLSDDEARSMGISLGAVRTVAVVAAGAAAAASVVLAGPIAFVGLIAPHVARGVLGAPHRVMSLGACIAGAALLTAAEAARQFVDLGGGRLPVGALTALVGGVAFLWLLRRTAGGWQS